jgi:protoheme IX farnesyltransferase
VYLELAKWRLSLLVVGAAVAGFLVAPAGPLHALRLLCAGVGTFLCAAGANGLNQWLEADRDRLMERTACRPLPSGRIGSAHALAASLSAAATGAIVLAAGCNLLTAALGVANIAIYILAYTPLKVLTPANTLVGAVCGAIPPVMGWTAAAGRLDLGAFALAVVLFAWQIPHSLALGYLYRLDYARAGFALLPVVDGGGLATFHVINLYCLALIPIPLGATFLGLAGWPFALGSTLLGCGQAALGFTLWRRRGAADARRLFLATLAYLPLLLGLLVADHRMLTG